MDFLNSMDLSQSGLTSQRQRMNPSHMNTTRTPNGGPYFTDRRPGNHLIWTGSWKTIRSGRCWKTAGISKWFSTPPTPMPTNSAEFGYVLIPNINVVQEEMGDLILGKRSYEANLTAATAAQNMALKSLDLPR